MPHTTDEVTADDLFAALHKVGSPTVWYAKDRDTPGDVDIPQLLGALTAAVEKLAIERGIMIDDAAAAAWTAGYIGTIGSPHSACTEQAAFDMIAVRQRATARMLAGYAGGRAAAGQLVAALADATARFATLAGSPRIVTGTEGLSVRELADSYDEAVRVLHAAAGLSWSVWMTLTRPSAGNAAGPTAGPAS